MTPAEKRTRAVAVVIRDGRVLLVRRHRTGVEEYHVIPGGGVEAGESPGTTSAS